MKVAGYVRVSTQEQASKGYSIQEQESKIRAFCDLKDYDLVTVYADPGYTGTNYDRPGLQQLLNECGQYDMVLVFRLDRLSRTQEGALHLVNELQRNGVAFNSITENFDTSTPIGKAMLGIAAAFAELDHDTILERMALGKEGRIRKGLWRGGSSVPIGYDYKNGNLCINKDGAEQVRKVFELFLAGWSTNSIAKYMRQNYGTAYNTWSASVCALRIIRNPLYKGYLSYKGELIKGQHEAIIPPETWDAAYAFWQTRYNALEEHKKNPCISRHLLTGLIKCRQCGERYVTRQSCSHSRTYVYYSCLNRKGKRCNNKILNEQEADALVIQEILQLDFETPHRQEPVDHTKEIRQIERQISKLIDLYSMDGISHKDLTIRIDKLNKRKEALQEPPEPKIELPPKEAVHDILSNGTFRERKNLVDSLIDRIEIDGEDFHIYWTF